MPRIPRSRWQGCTVRGDVASVDGPNGPLEESRRRAARSVPTQPRLAGIVWVRGPLARGTGSTPRWVGVRAALEVPVGADLVAVDVVRVACVERERIGDRTADVGIAARRLDRR